MAPKKTPTPAEPPRTELLVPTAKARAQIEARIGLGQQMLSQLKGPVSGLIDQAAAKLEAEHEKWTGYNAELLRRLFSDDERARAYEWCTPSADVSFEHHSYGPAPPRTREKIEAELRFLDSLLDRLELFPAPADSAAAAGTVVRPASQAADFTRVFLVHGHDDGAKESTARFLEKLGITAVILHEQPNLGKTLIEKLEHYGKVPFAVVLLTPDDEGRAKGAVTLNPRARQNVVLELGYFVGLLGRKHVCALYKGGVELPSDYDGVVWMNMDGEWRFTLARELKAAGFAVNMNLVV
jgi:predicted nucleotide-binding protein